MYDFIDGNLAEMLKDEEGMELPLPQDQSLYYLQQILEGVNFLHQSGYLHLDIKGMYLSLSFSLSLSLLCILVQHLWVGSMAGNTTSFLLPVCNKYDYAVCNNIEALPWWWFQSVGSGDKQISILKILLY